MARASRWALVMSGLCSISISVICLPMVMVGFSEVSGSWKIMEISAPRILSISFSERLAMLRPLRMTSPESILPPMGSRPMMALFVMDLPEPDSPTMASVSPSFRSKLTPRTACTMPLSV